MLIVQKLSRPLSVFQTVSVDTVGKPQSTLILKRKVSQFGIGTESAVSLLVTFSLVVAEKVAWRYRQSFFRSRNVSDVMWQTCVSVITLRFPTWNKCLQMNVSALLRLPFRPFLGRTTENWQHKFHSRLGSQVCRHCNGGSIKYNYRLTHCLFWFADETLLCHFGTN